MSHASAGLSVGPHGATVDQEAAGPAPTRPAGVAMIADHPCNAYCSGGVHCDLVYVSAAGEPDWTPAGTPSRCG
jgi:hypothetical protein